MEIPSGRSVTELYGRHPESDIYVVGTGTSLRVFPKGFLAGRITIGLNMAWKMVDVQYGMTIHPELNIPELMPAAPPRPGITWITKVEKLDRLNKEQIRFAKEHYYFFRTDGRANTMTNGLSDSGRFPEWVSRANGPYLYIWTSIAQPAVNLAANMGARNVILVGCDNASLMGNHHSHSQHTRWLGAEPDDRYRDYFEGLAEVRTALRARDVNLVSLTPFLSLGPHERDFTQLCDELELPPVVEPQADITSIHQMRAPTSAARAKRNAKKSLRRRIPAPALEWLRARRSPRPIPEDADDIVFVIAEQNRGEILEGICHRIAARTPGRVGFHYGDSPLPPARTYFFSHWGLFYRARNDPFLRSAVSIVFFTHPHDDPRTAQDVAKSMRSCTKVIAMSSPMARHLIENGVPIEKVTVVIGGADPAEFRPHVRGNGAVGFHSKLQERKAPETVLEIVRAMPHRRFRLTGRKWREAAVFDELAALPNFEYAEDERATRTFYDTIDVFVSPSRLEGGPIPLIEAMMSNVVPVATRTGVAPDVIEHGVNGFLCDVGASASEFAERIDAAYALETDVRATAEHLTWDAFVRGVVALLPAGEHSSGTA